MPVLKITTKEVQTRVSTVQAMSKLPRQLLDEPLKDQFLYDTVLQGFGCKITAGGKASWFVERRFGGSKNIRKKIGTWPAMSIDAARQQGQIVLGQIANGVDVSREKRDSRAVQQATLTAKTVTQLWNEYIGRHECSQRYNHGRCGTFKRVIEPVIGHLSPKQVTKQQLQEMIDSQSRGMKYQLYALLSKFLKDMVRRDHIAASPLIGIERPSQGKERQRIMTENEIRAYWDAASKIEYPLGHYFKFMLLTGQRRNETRIAEWSEIHGNEWHIPPEHTKNELPHTVHLSEQALAVLDGCIKSSKWIFTEFGVRPIAGAGDIWALMLALMVHPGMNASEIRRKGKDYRGLVELYQGPELRLHDVRRSMASTMVNRLGVAPHTVHKILNHKERDTLSKSYLQYEMSCLSL
jgi:integrase